jgi:hypothetical protein
MKPLSYLKLAVLAMPILLGGCKSTKSIVKEPAVKAPVDTVAASHLRKVSDNSILTKFVTSKVKFTIEMGDQNLSLTGNLRMKHDDVIRLQLMAFGFVEAARIEFTKDYVLILDRINKQFIKARYDEVDFLRTSGLNFYSLQSLFWNELFLPGQTTMTDELLKNFQTTEADKNIIISYQKDKMSYKWLSDAQDGTIKMANILYKDKYRGNSQLNWEYDNFQPFNAKQCPCNHKITFSNTQKTVTLTMLLTGLDKDSDWDTRTFVSSKYKEVSVDDILRRFMAL